MSHSYNSIEEVLKAVKSNQLSINDALLKLTYIEHSVKGFPKLSLGKEKQKDRKSVV